MRVIPRYRPLGRSLPRRMRWTRARVPARRRVPIPHRPEGRAIVRPSARVSLLHLTATLAVAVVIWTAGATFQTAYANRIYPHITIDNLPVGGMTRAEALAALNNTETARINAPIFVEAAEKSWQVTPAQFGTRYDTTSAVDRALALAHSGPFLLGGWNEIQTIWNGANVELSGRHDPVAVARFLAGAAAAVHISPRQAAVGVQGRTVAMVRAPKVGRKLDLAGAAAVLGAAINTRAATMVSLPLQPVESALGVAQADAAVTRARALLAAPIQFLWTAGYNQSWQLTPSATLRLLTFTPRCAAGSCRFDMGINVHKLALAFDRGGVAMRVDRPPTPASYQLLMTSFPPRVEVVPDSQGVAIDVASAAAQILQQGNQPADQRKIFLPTRPLFTTFNTAAAQALNFNQNVGAGTARYPISIMDWARQNNLNVAANVISNKIIWPNRTFSVATAAGPLTGHYGYIRGQNTVGPGDITGANSGVDLVASTALAAAYDAGLPIERRVHYPYLTAFTLPGFDATVTYSKHGPDVVFRNTTDHAILVMTWNDGKGGVGVYLFNSSGYAPSHHRTSGYYDSTVSPPELSLNPDGSVDTVVRRRITIDGHVTHDHLSSHYAPIDP